MFTSRVQRLSSSLVIAYVLVALQKVEAFASKSCQRRQVAHKPWTDVVRNSLDDNSAGQHDENEQSTPSDGAVASATAAIAPTLTVSYGGQSCEITVLPEETILAALERQSQHLKSHLTALPEMPSDCRRGNCLTCAASCSSQEQQLTAHITVRDGLSPVMSKLVADKGFVLTCCSYLTQSSGLQLQLGTNHQLWMDVYASPGRFTTHDAQLAARTAMARVIRKSAERNVEQWALETERVLRTDGRLNEAAS